jgi:5-methyltetrahydrofolate--homocysteine methyltransferase
VIRFTDKQWDQVIDNYRKWWKGELGRPILPMIITGTDPGRPMPKAPLLCFSNCADFSIPADALIDRIDYELSTYEFYGDSFPWVNMHNFGPGVAAAFLGAVLQPAENTVWFHYEKKIPIEEMHFTYDGNNIWLNRIKDIYAAGMRKWGGEVCMAMTDLGGNLDILASFLGTEGLLFEVMDHPKEVKRLCIEITELWLRFYRELVEIIRGQRVFSDWSAMLSEKPSYMLQCDFSYMIGTSMFKDFVHDDLDTISSTLDKKTFYHLDGIGEIKHLEDLFTIDGIKGIQWIPGAGEPETRDWSELLGKISKAGKKIMVGYRLDSYLDEILRVVKKPDELIKMQFFYPQENKDAALNTLAKYGAV